MSLIQQSDVVSESGHKKMDAKTRRRTKRGPKQRTRETNSRDREKKKVANQQLFEDDEKREQEKDNFLKLGQNANEASRYSHYNHHTVNFLVNGEGGFNHL